MTEREEGFKVTDRRKYNPDGSPRESGQSEGQPIAPEPDPQSLTSAPAAIKSEADASNVVTFPAEAARKESEMPKVETPSDPIATEPVQTPQQANASHAEKAYNQTRGAQSSRLPEATFLSLANMLAVEAAMHLGLIQTPGEEAPPPDMEAARHLIDMLGILQTKSRGNLTSEEDNLLENMLADLRMQFVAITRRR